MPDANKIENVEKYELINFCGKLQTFLPLYGGFPLLAVSEVIDLGIIPDNKLSIVLHYSFVISNKTNRVLRCIKMANILSNRILNIFDSLPTCFIYLFFNTL